MENERQLIYLNGPVKRAIDAGSMFVFSPILVPIIGAAALVIKMDGGGEIFFRQKKGRD